MARRSASEVDNLYRGGESEYPAIQADKVTVTTVAEPVADIEDQLGIGLVIEDTFDVISRETVEVAGGLSSRVAGAAKFANSGAGVGAVVVFDPDAVSPRLQPIKYNLEWFDDHPGLLARVDTLAVGEIRSQPDEKVVAFEYPEGVMATSGRANMELKATREAYATEKEYFAYNPTIDLSNSIRGGLGVAHTQSGLGSSLKAGLREIDGYSGAGFGQNTSIASLTSKERVEELAQPVRKANSILGPQDDFWMVGVDTARNWASNGGISNDAFFAASNGKRIVTRVNRLPDFIPVKP